MFLSPVKQKLSVPYPELFSLLKKSDGVLHDKVVDESSLDSYAEVEVLDNFKQLYLSLDTPIEKKVLYRSYFEQDTWTQTTLAKDLHISPTKLKRIKAKIEKKALDLGIK